MELVEFHVGDPAAGTPCHGNAVTGVGVRVAGVEVHLAGATGGQYHVAGAAGEYILLVAVENVGTQTAVMLQSQFATGDEVDGNIVFHQTDIAAFSRLVQQCRFHGAAGGIGGMQHPAGGVAALLGEMKIVFGSGKRYAKVDQPLDYLRCALNGETYRLRIIQAGASVQGVGDV